MSFPLLLRFSAFFFFLSDHWHDNRRRIDCRELLSKSDVGRGYENLTEKSEFGLLQTLSRLFQVVQFVKRWQMFLEFNSKRLYQSSGKEKESRCCLVFTSSIKREIRNFPATAKKCTKKLLFWQSKPIIAFWPFSLPSPSSLLTLPIYKKWTSPVLCLFLSFQAVSLIGIKLFLAQLECFIKQSGHDN